MHVLVRLLTMGKTDSDHPGRTTSLDVDTGKIRMTFPTFVAIIVAIVAAAAAGGGALGSFAKKDDIKAHSHKAHRDEDGKLVSAPASIVDTVEANEDAVRDLKKDVDQINEGQKYIHAKIDLLIETQLIEGERNPRARRAMKRAATKVRQRAALKDDMPADPLEGVGLDDED